MALRRLLREPETGFNCILQFVPDLKMIACYLVVQAAHMPQDPLCERFLGIVSSTASSQLDQLYLKAGERLQGLRCYAKAPCREIVERRLHADTRVGTSVAVLIRQVAADGRTVRPRRFAGCSRLGLESFVLTNRAPSLVRFRRLEGCERKLR